jgi:tetratricopeptide (TPR) repeat protein
MDRLLLSRTLFLMAAVALCLIPVSQVFAADSPQVSVALVPLTSATPAELEKQGDLLRGEKRYLDSIDYYKAAMSKEPSARLCNKTGMSYLFLQRNHEAQKEFDHAIKLDKKAPEGYNNRAYIELTKKDYGKAIKYYIKAVTLRPDCSDFHYNLGSAYFDKHDYERAAREFHTAFAMDPDIFDRHSRTGIAARASSPDDRAAFDFMVARMYAQLGDFDRSLQYLRKAMEDGYKEIKKVYTDSEFATLRTDKRFSELMSQRPQPIP